MSFSSRRGSFRSSIIAAALYALFPLVYHSSASAEGARPQELKASFASSDSSGSLRKVSFEPLNLRGGSQLTLISPQAFAPLAEKIRTVLERTHDHYTVLLGDIPAFTTAIRLMDEETFFIATGAPRWTNAMYYRNQIIIPLAENVEIDMDGVTRAVKHEYTHAVLHALSNGRCPGWLDEGLAQWAEGSENPALQPALRSWVRERGIVPLLLLQGGFTKLSSDMVPAAYAQSLYSAYVVMNSYGFSGIRSYLDRLRAGEDKSSAFRRALGTSERDFERRLSVNLSKWVHSHHSIKAAGTSTSLAD